jgi:hypothetical protein
MRVPQTFANTNCTTGTFGIYVAHNTYTLLLTAFDVGECEFMRTVGYCALWAIALALFITMCAVLRDNLITHNISVREQAAESGIHIAVFAAASGVSTSQ